MAVLLGWARSVNAASPGTGRLVSGSVALELSVALTPWWLHVVVIVTVQPSSVGATRTQLVELLRSSSRQVEEDHWVVGEGPLSLS